MKTFAKSFAGVVIAASVITSAFAQTASPEQVAAAKARAGALIAASGAPDKFADVSADGLVRIRHLPSNAICTFEPDAPGARLETGPEDAAACYDATGGLRRLRIARAASGITEFAQARAAAEALRAPIALSMPASAVGPAIIYDQGARGQAYAFGAVENRQRLSFWVGVVKVGDWFLTQEVAAPSPPPRSKEVSTSDVTGQALLKAVAFRMTGELPD